MCIFLYYIFEKRANAGTLDVMAWSTTSFLFYFILLSMTNLEDFTFYMTEDKYSAYSLEDTQNKVEEPAVKITFPLR